MWVALSKQRPEPTLNSGLRPQLNQLPDSIPTKTEAFIRAFTATTRSYKFPQLTTQDLQQVRFQRQSAEKRLEWLKMQISNINNDDTPAFSTGLNSSAYSENHENLPEGIKQIENATALRRAEPFLMSDMLGDDVLFSMKQLGKKGRGHLKRD